MKTQYARWSDNDRHFGPFTYARGGFCPFAVVLGSGGDEDTGCRLRLSGFGHTLIIALPTIVRPHRHWVDTSKYEWSDNPRGGYWAIEPRDFGFSVGDGFLQVFLGRRTMDSTTDRTKGYFLPWKQWRHVRHSLYDLEGRHFATLPEYRRLGSSTWKEREVIRDGCPTRTFGFYDYDGEELTAITMIEEREWRRGEGYFKWLSWFYKPKISRSLDIRFSGETGKRKGSWKGGTIGHSIDMLPGELHEAAFQRYCDEHQMTKRETLPVSG